MTTTRDTAPVLLRSLRKKRLAAALFRGLRETRDVLIGLGHPDPLSYELHVPMPVQKSGMLAALEIARHLDVVHKRTLYGNLAGLGGDQTGDVKILHRAPCRCKSDCSCTELCEVYLPGLVHDVVSVDIDGKTLPPEVYRVDAPGRLVRVDGGCWPECQDMAEPSGAPGTFTVTYRWGLALNDAAIAAVSELTCHFLKGCAPGGSCGCKATRNLTRVTRQGVELETADPTLIYSEGRTGLPVADMWLAAVNPYRMTSPSRVYSPDCKRPRVTTWP